MNRERLNPLQVFGFCLFVLGTSAIYNEVIVVPFYNLERFTKKVIEERKAKGQEYEADNLSNCC